MEFCYESFDLSGECSSCVGIAKGGVHIRGEICPRSEPDIAHMEYSMDPLKFIYKPLLLYGHQGARFGEILARFGHSNPMESHIMVSLPMFRPNIILFT